MINFFIGLAALIALPFIAALFVRRDYEVSREITIDRPKKEVFNYIRFIKNQDHFSKWNMMDPEMIKDFKGTDGNEGFVYAWDGNNKAGKGEQEIVKIVDGALVETEVRFIRPFKSVAITSFFVESIDYSHTKVKWVMRGKSKYPMNLMTLFMGKILGNDIEFSLNTLKTIQENQKQPTVAK
jgi:hypothetical protein